MTIQFQRAVPIIRMFSVEKAREFYLDFLGFKVEAEHRFHDEAPLFMVISRDGLVLHLSEHHGDACPGSHTYVYVSGVRDLHRELNDKKYRYNCPGLKEQEWGVTEVSVTDPFNNRITFGESTAALKQATA
jgi:catechol 2,3-dioxygenase-like lactoylglutathione lyase family enzyme